jgi:Spy/CpxP family protein refolding chaperone
MMRHASKALTFLLLAATVAGAQEPGRGRRGGGGGGADNPGGNMRAARQAIERLIRNQVRPTDEQMVKLRQIDQRFMPRRTQLDREEQQVRADLRQAMLDSANLNEPRIGQLLDRMISFPGRRAALMEEEQKSLAEVLTPLQRAKYHAIQEQLRRRIDQGRGGPPPRKPPRFP